MVATELLRFPRQRVGTDQAAKWYNPEERARRFPWPVAITVVGQVSDIL